MGLCQRPWHGAIGLALVLSLLAPACRATPTATPVEPLTTGTVPNRTERPGSIEIVPAHEQQASTNVRLNFWLYFLQPEPSGVATQPIGYDLHVMHAWTGETRRLTHHAGNGNVGLQSNAVALSPNQSRIAYKVDGGSEDALWVADAEHERPRELFRHERLGRFGWSPDGEEIYIGTRDERRGVETIQQVRSSDGGARTLVHSERYLLSVVGVGNGDLLYWEIDTARSPSRTLLVRLDTTTGLRRAQLDVGSLGETAWSRDGSTLYFSSDRGSGLDPRSVFRVDLRNDGLQAERVPSATGHESHLAVSPNGSRLVMSVGEERAQWDTELYFVDLDVDDGPLYHLTTHADGGAIHNVVWTPDSQAVVFGYGGREEPHLWVMAQDGTPRDLEMIGTPVALRLEGR